MSILAQRLLLCSAALVASPQIVDVDDQSSFVFTDHVPDLVLVNPLVLLRKSDRGLVPFSFSGLTSFMNGSQRRNRLRNGNIKDFN